MTTYRTLDILDGTEPGDPPAGNVIARRTATKLSMHQQLEAQDRIIGSGARIVMQLALGSVSDTFVADTDPDLAATDPTYPDTDTVYVVARADKVPVTPGSVLAFTLLALPSGATQYEVTAGDWDPSVAGGTVRVAVTLTNSAAQTVAMTRDIVIPPSQLQFNAKPSDPGKGWEIVKAYARIHIPDGFDDIPATMAKWSGPYMLATITISHIASPRIIDLVVHEVPRRLAKDISTGNWPAHLYAQGGQPYDQYPYIFPVEQASTTDPAIGLEHAIATANETGWQLGPAIFHWSSWNQDTATILTLYDTTSHGNDNANGTGDNEAPALTSTSTTFHHMLSTAWTSYDAANPGFSMGSGAYGRHYRTADTAFILPNNGVVEVIVGVYGNTGLTTGTVRFQTSPYSYVDVEIAVGSDAWSYATATLECGVGPEDDVNVQVFVKIDVSGTMALRNLVMYYRSDSTL